MKSHYAVPSETKPPLLCMLYSGLQTSKIFSTEVCNIYILADRIRIDQNARRFDLIHQELLSADWTAVCFYNLIANLYAQ